MEKPEWKSVNWFIVSFESSFDQLKIYFYTEIKKKKKTNTSSLKTVNHHRAGGPRWSSG